MGFRNIGLMCACVLCNVHVAVVYVDTDFTIGMSYRINTAVVRICVRHVAVIVLDRRCDMMASWRRIMTRVFWTMEELPACTHTHTHTHTPFHCSLHIHCTFPLHISILHFHCAFSFCISIRNIVSASLSVSLSLSIPPFRILFI